jgi:hypothetical protein
MSTPFADVVRQYYQINKSIKPGDRKAACQEKKEFYLKVLKMTEDMIESYFVARQYQNGEQPPQKFNSDVEMIAYVAQEVGAIAYVNAASLKKQALEKVKVVFTKT